MAKLAHLYLFSYTQRNFQTNELESPKEDITRGLQLKVEFSNLSTMIL